MTWEEVIDVLGVGRANELRAAGRSQPLSEDQMQVLVGILTSHPVADVDAA